MSQVSPLVADLAKHLRGRILAGEFAAEERVTESGLASEYGVARPTARSAVDVLVSEGLLVRSPFAALRVPAVAESELPELLGILEFVERAALERILTTDPDLRGLRRATSGSLHHFLDVVVRSSESPRLEWIHRRTTFEFILCCQQAAAKSVHDDEALQPAMLGVADALLTRREEDARAGLASLQTARHDRSPARLGA